MLRRALALLALFALLLAPTAEASPGSGHWSSWAQRHWIARDIPGCVLWLRADMGVTLTSGKVSTWADQSGQGNHATQSTAALRPTQNTTGGPNSTAILNFASATGQYLSFPASAFSALTAAEIYIVTRVTSGNTLGLWVFGNTTGGAQELFPYSDGAIYEQFGTTARKNTGVFGGTITNWNAYNISTASGAYTTRYNGTQQFTTASNTVGWDTSPEIGRSYNIFFNGDIAEIIMVNRVLSTAERSIVNKYLGLRYSITTT